MAKPKRRRCNACKLMLPIAAFGKTPYASDCEACRERNHAEALALLEQGWQGLLSLGYTELEAASWLVNGVDPKTSGGVKLN